MDREIPQSVVKKRRIKLLIKGAVGFAIFSGFIMIVSMLTSSTVSLSNITVSTVDEGAVEVSLAAAGKVVPCYEEAVISPIASRILKVISLPGDTVTKGQPLLAIDTEKLQFEYQRMKAEYMQTNNRHRKLKLEIKQKEADASMQREIQVLKIDALKSTYAGEKYLLSIGGCAKESVEKLKMEVAVAELELENSTKRLEQGRKITELEIQSLDIDLSIQKNKLVEVENMLSKAAMGAPINGIVSFLLNKPGMAIGAGDVLAKVADLSRYSIEATVGDSYAGKVQVGQEVVVRVGKVEVLGRIANVSPSVADGTLNFSVALAHTAYSSFRANMKVELRIVAQRVNNTLRIGIGEYYRGPGEYELFVVSESSAEKRFVELGGCSFSHVQVVRGIKKGETVITSDMKAYERVKRLKVKG